VVRKGREEREIKMKERSVGGEEAIPVHICDPYITVL